LDFQFLRYGMKISELKKQAPKRNSKNNEKMYLRLRLNI